MQVYLYLSSVITSSDSEPLHIKNSIAALIGSIALLTSGSLFTKIHKLVDLCKSLGTTICRQEKRDLVDMYIRVLQVHRVVRQVAWHQIIVRNMFIRMMLP